METLRLRDSSNTTVVFKDRLAPKTTTFWPDYLSFFDERSHSSKTKDQRSKPHLLVEVAHEVLQTAGEVVVEVRGSGK